MATKTIRNYDLICKAKQADKASMETLLNLYKGLINKIASYYFYHLKVTHLEFNELVAEGQIGFIKAVERFDIEKGYELSTYVTYGIKNSILNALRECSMIKVSTRDVMNQVNANKTNKNNEKTAIYNLDLIDTSENMELCMYYSKKSNNTYMDSNLETEIVDNIHNKKLYANIHESLNGLTYEEGLIVNDFYGFNADRCLNLKEISHKYDIPYNQVRTLKGSAILKLQKSLKNCDNNSMDSYKYVM